jgi:hypothetical protein
MPTSVPLAAARSAAKTTRRGAAKRSPTKNPAPALALQRAVANPRQATPAAIRALQAHYGNRAVQGLIQTKLLVGPAHDGFEQEADRIAERVMRGGHGGSAASQTGGVQRVGAGDGFEAGPQIEARLATLAGQGRPLPDGVRTRMETGMQADFQGVRVHTDAESHQLNRSLQAQAFTHGQDIYMGEGKYNPGSSQGQHLLAHELAHVVQQTGPGVQRQPHAEDEVQRFPANVLTAPINWNAQNFAVRQSSSGAMGGVSFLQSTKPVKGEVNSIVVKALVAGEGEQVQLGEKVLTTLGVNVPNSRQVHAGEPEFAQLAHALDLPLDPQGIAHTVNHRAIHTFMVMQSLPAQSLGDMAVEARTEDDIDQLVNVLVDTNLLRTVGRMAVFDTAIGNFDRITSEGLNFGNIMVSDPDAHSTLQFWAIDTAANLPKLEGQILERVTHAGGFDENSRSNPGLLKKLMDRGPADLGARFVDGLSMHMMNTQSAKVMGAGTEGEQMEIMKDSPRVQQLAMYLSDSLAAVRNEMIALICEGYHTGIERLVAMMSVENKEGEDRQAIKAEAQASGSWETLKAHTRYLEMRAREGLDHATAAEFVKRYAEYRALRNTDVPAPGAADPLRFVDLEFPDILLKDRPLLARNATKQNFKQDQARQAANFMSDLREFVREVDVQNDDLHRLQSPATFALNQMREELRREAIERRQGNQRGAAPAMDSTALKRKALLMQKISNLYRVSLSVLAYAEIYKLKGNAFMPGLGKLKDGSLREYGPSLATQLDTLFKEMELMKTLHRRLEVHAGTTP